MQDRRSLEPGFKRGSNPPLPRMTCRGPRKFPFFKWSQVTMGSIRIDRKHVKKMSGNMLKIVFAWPRSSPKVPMNLPPSTKLCHEKLNRGSSSHGNRQMGITIRMTTGNMLKQSTDIKQWQTIHILDLHPHEHLKNHLCGSPFASISFCSRQIKHATGKHQNGKKRTPKRRAPNSGSDPSKQFCSTSLSSSNMEKHDSQICGYLWPYPWIIRRYQ